MPVYDDPGLCKWLLSNIAASVPLEIKRSSLITPNTCIHQESDGPTRSEHYHTKEFRHTGDDCTVGTHSGLFLSDADEGFGGLRAGEEIYNAAPVMWAVSSHTHPSICNFCFGDQDEERAMGGQPRTRGPVLLCAKCKVARFCSRDCQKKAWEDWHKDECGLLRERPGMGLVELLVCRLLFWQQRKILRVGESTCLQRMGGNFEKWLAEPGAAKRLETSALEIWKAVGEEGPLSLPWRLLRVLPCNILPLRKPSKNTMVGLVLELVGAQINHSCDPNAFMIFEGGEIRVRSLRDIAPGEEITVCYSDPIGNTMERLNRLLLHHAFSCRCISGSRCSLDLHAQRTICNTPDCVSRFYQAQVDMFVALRQYLKASHYSADSGWVRHDVAALEVRIDVIRASVAVSPAGHPWPDDLEPMPEMHQKLAMLYLEQGNPLSALRCALRGCMLRFHRHGPEWINSMRDVMMPVLLTVGAMPADAPAFQRDPSWDLTPTDIQTVTYGYIHEVAREAQTAFGMDSEYAGSLDSLSSSSAGRTGLRIWTRSFVEEEYEPAQRKLLAWAGVPLDYGVKMTVSGNEQGEETGLAETLG
ncbi:uncharacterized protein C8A04DRAFT_13120 [Dichotomopilus funicola]|uniref:Suppressor of anucleate metulae protein B n=1 Tax=Dichotomopilus funicola TaxID=1934379 RepID=A0AAN6V0D1_9PEZI|nr:hypothetical protein C8A04DRAFT_13120 [Dichotomopilus funicola]